MSEICVTEEEKTVWEVDPFTNGSSFKFPWFSLRILKQIRNFTGLHFNKILSDVYSVDYIQQLPLLSIALWATAESLYLCCPSKLDVFSYCKAADIQATNLI